MPVILGATALLTRAQSSIVYEGESTGTQVVVNGLWEGTEPMVQAVWRGVPNALAVFQVQLTMAAPEGAHMMLDRLVEAGVGAYLDARIHFHHDGVVADLTADQMAREIDAMITAAGEEYGVTEVALGLSGATREQLVKLSRISWEQASNGVNAGGEQDKYLAIYYFVRGQRTELERQLRADLLPLSAVPLVREVAASPGTTVKVNSTCGTVFDQDNYLCALDLQLASGEEGAVDPAIGDGLMSTLTAEAERAAEAAKIDRSPVRKRDRWLKAELDAIHERIDRMDQRKELWELRDRLEDLDDRLTGVEMDLEQVRENGVADNPIADLSDLTGDNITVRFERNSIGLASDQRVLLNEVFEQLARNPGQQVLITGYTDRSGEPSVNLRLSEQRAKSVRSYLLQRGISPERLLVNYYGDSRSTGRAPEERRVEIEWLP
ncbi:MAG: OmpA family protein [Flavobacteriales bacterium]|nr:OmpA family protein [Flavobacteriales bacterium]